MSEVLVEQPGYIYIARSDDGLVKIGSSAKPRNRVEHLRLELLHTLETNRMRLAEYRLHRLYLHRWVRGELFSLAATEVQYLLGLEHARQDFSTGELQVAAAYETYKARHGGIRATSGWTNVGVALAGLIDNCGRMKPSARSMSGLRELFAAFRALGVECGGVTKYIGPDEYGFDQMFDQNAKDPELHWFCKLATNATWEMSAGKRIRRVPVEV